MSKLFVLLFLAVFLFSCNSGTEPTEIIQEERQEDPRGVQLREYFDALTGLDDFNGCVLVKSEDSILLEQAFNMEDSGHSMYVTKDSQFDIHSVSKMMAHAVIIDLEKAGKMSRQDFISKYLPDFPNGDRITIQHLLDNASGLPRELDTQESRNRAWSVAELLQAIGQEDLEFEPGTDKRYSNLGYQIVYHLISIVVDKPFDVYMKKDVFDPLGMSRSGGHPYSDKVNLSTYVKNNELGDEGIEVVPSYTLDSKPQARLYSTITDLSMYLDHLDKEPYRSALVKESGVIAWAGGSDGIRAYISSDTKSDYHFILLANYDGIPMEQIIEDVSHIMKGEEYEIPKEIHRNAIDLDPASLERYTGTYDFVEADHLELHFAVERDSLIAYQDGERICVLLAENDSVFFADSTSSESFTFYPSREGDKVMMDWLGISFEGLRK